MKIVKWGIIGVGDVTEVKSGPAFNKVENSEIVMVMRRTVEKAKDYAKRHGIPYSTSDSNEIINNPDINAIYIATPPSTHAEYTIKAANAGKHVYVEKPMAISFSECQNMVHVCKTNKVKLFVAYYRRELEYFKKVKEIVNSGIIGDIKCVDIKFLAQPKKDDYDKNNLPWRVKPEIAGAGYFFDLASHQLDFLDFLFGPIDSAKGFPTNQLGLYGAEDIVTASFKFENNILGTGTWCFTIEDHEELDCTTIYGSSGNISFSFFSPTPILVISKDGRKEYQINYPTHVQQPLINTLVGDLLGGPKCVSTGISAQRTNLAMEKILYDF